MNEKPQGPKSVRTSPLCGTVSQGALESCPACGSRTMTPDQAQTFGTIWAVCGGALLAIMLPVTISYVPLIAAGGEWVGNSRFEGTRAQGAFALAVFALVIAVGAAALFEGIQRTRLARPRGWLVRILFGAVSALLVIGLLARRGLFG